MHCIYGLENKKLNLLTDKNGIEADNNITSCKKKN